RNAPLDEPQATVRTRAAELAQRLAETVLAIRDQAQRANTARTKRQATSLLAATSCSIARWIGSPARCLRVSGMLANPRSRLRGSRVVARERGPGEQLGDHALACVA